MENHIDKLEEWSSKNYRRPYQRTFHLKQLKAFVEWTKKTPEQLITEGLAGISERMAPRLITDYYQYLAEQRKKDSKKSKYGLSSVMDAINAIRSFYKYYGVTMKFARSELDKVVATYTDHRFALAEINGMVHTATTLRNKAIVLFAISTGLREMDIAQLPRKRIESLLDQEPPICLGPLNTEKARVTAYPFLTKIAVDFLKRYLATRTDDTDLLFPTDQGKPCQGDYLNRMVQEAYSKAGFKAAEGERVRFHALRKFNVSRMQDAGLEENVWKTMIGKSTKESAYTTEMLREHFIKVQDKLNPEAIVNNHAKMEDLDSKISRLEKENIELRTEIAQLQAKKGLEVLMELYAQKQKELNDEALKKAVPASHALNLKGSVKREYLDILNGHKPARIEPIAINGAEVLTLKALAQVFQKLFDDQTKET